MFRLVTVAHHHLARGDWLQAGCVAQIANDGSEVLQRALDLLARAALFDTPRHAQHTMIGAIAVLPLFERSAIAQTLGMAHKHNQQRQPHLHAARDVRLQAAKQIGK